MSTASTSRTRPLPRPLHLVSNSISIPSSPLTTTNNGLQSAPLSGSKREGLVTSPILRTPAPRRQSSISYNTGSSKPQLPGLNRSNATGINTESDAIIIEGLTHENCVSKVLPLPAVRETEPVTLAEKHADLLRFIAQKESKCLELRTQLAQHEADLLLLKRKWERIVSKGLPSSSRSDASIYAAVDMLGDIREGVQNGLEKVLAVLEPNVSTSSQTNTSKEGSPLNMPSSSPPFLSKRTSISTTSSISTHGGSSLSNSRSSASSLFDDISSIQPKSLKFSAQDDDDDETACTNIGTKKLPSETNFRSRTSSPTVQSPTQDEDNDTSGKKPRSRPLSMSLSQFSPILPTAETLTPISKQMTNWVPPGLNKKWEDLKGNETISKQSKRATVLFNDILAVLASPVGSFPQTPSSASARNNLSSRTSSKPPRVTDASFVDKGTLSSAGFNSKASVLPSASLLDDDADLGLGDVMKPDMKSTLEGARKPQDDNTNPAGESEEEEWNW